MTDPTDPRSNGLLAALTDTEWQRCGPQFECVNLQQGQVLRESDATALWVYFPTSAIVSLTYDTAEGASAEVAVVGSEGLVGVTALLGDGRAPFRSLVTGKGLAFRICVHALKDEFDRCGPLTQLLLRFTQALISQITQTATCNLQPATCNLQPATATTIWSSKSAASCCSAWTGPRAGSFC